MTVIQSHLPGFNFEEFGDRHDPLSRVKGISPYFQRPPLDSEEADDLRLYPHQLFYLFTAQVIEQQQVFIR